MEKELFEKLKITAIILTVIVFFTDIYYYYYGDMIDIGFQNKFFDYYINFVSKTNLFKYSITPKTIIFCCAAAFVLADKGKKDKEINKEAAIQHGIISSIVFLSTSLLPSIIGHIIIYLFLIVMAYIYLIQSFSSLNRLLNKSVMDDRYNLENKTFPQTTKLIENEMSINIPYKFVSGYEKKGKDMYPVFEDGYINFVAPERSTLILGKPGSGKSYSFNEEFIRQAIIKSYSMINYDFKFPTLTNVAYNYFLKYKDNYKKYPGEVIFGVINLDDPRYSNRCNPLHPDLLEKKQHAMDVVYTIFYNLDKKSAIRQDFFQMSAMSITTAILWFLKNFEDGKFCSFPHLIEFISQSDEKILPILDAYPDLRYFTSAFTDALAKESFEQLSGQTASARIPLGKCATPEMFWVMTDPNNEGINLRVNEKNHPTILNIANNPITQKTNAPGLGLYISQAATLINQQDRVPCLFHVDELPTIFINGLNTLIATARSNKVSVVLSAQDYTQLVMDYGKEIADTIFNTVGNIASGQVAIDTARKISDAVGKINYQTQSISINNENTSVSYNTQRDYIVPPEDIAQMTQGEFVGVVADTFDQKIKTKAFRGLVAPSKSDLGKEQFQMIYPELTKEILHENEKQIQEDIKYIIEVEWNKINLMKLAEDEEKFRKDKEAALIDQNAEAERSMSQLNEDPETLDHEAAYAEGIYKTEIAEKLDINKYDEDDDYPGKFKSSPSPIIGPLLDIIEKNKNDI